jgi:esterase/lipase
LAWARLPQIVAPTLLVQSRADNRTTPVVAERALARIGSTEKQLVWLDAGAHVITVDHGRDAVAAGVGEWLDTHTPSKARARLVRPA